MKSILLSLIALAHLGLANPQDYGGGYGSSSTATVASTATATSEDSDKTQTVQVGNGGFTFQPNSITAEKGDVVEFVVHSTHSVASSTFDNPCQPISGAGAIWSGFSSNDNTIFSVTINDTNPIWLYCAAPEHCQSGMAMVINPPSGGNNIAAYQAAAKSSSNSGHAPNIAGGIFGKPVSNSASGSATGGASGSASSTGAAPTATPSSSGSGPGAVIANIMLVGGMLFGGVAFLL